MKQQQIIKRGTSPLTIRERSIIEIRWCTDKKTVSDIARELNRNKSTISRDIAGKPRIGRGRYQAELAQAQAIKRLGNRGNTSKTIRFPELKDYIETKLKLGWSPEQISIRLPIVYEANETMRISPEAVYQEVYRRVRRAGNGIMKDGQEDLRPYLPRRHTRRAKKGFRKAQKLERQTRLPSIETRPTVVDTRSRIGDWEDDTVVSRESLVRIKSTNERRSGIVLFRKAKDGTAKECDSALAKALGVIPEEYRLTLTRDRGKENVRHDEVQASLGFVEGVFFAHPYSSYERGSNENNNGLLRRFYPKKTDWNNVSEADLAKAEYLINTRPRKRHGGLSPVEVFFRDTGVALYS